MPFQRPQEDDVIELARKLGIHLTRTEARIFQSRMLEHLSLIHI